MRRPACALVALALVLAACGGDDDVEGGGDVLLEDDFSDDDSGFTVSEGGTGSLAYDGGGYVIESLGPNGLKVSDTDLDGEAFVESLASLGDVRVEVDVAKLADDGPALMGVLCRLRTEPPSYYAGFVDSDGYWRLVRFGGTTTVLAEGDQRTRVEGLDDDDAHRLRLDCVDGPGGAALGLMVDGAPVAAA
ncbi:MAG TPA: hypothetical protein VJ804_07590, partial [Acidimicrobiales bacterium]|nr:hypothetical protein [Acidimicrobiales bacterium]